MGGRRAIGLLAAVVLALRYPIRGGAAVTLASGSWLSAHADFINVSEPTALAVRIRDCLHRGIKCGPGGTPLA